MENNENLNNQVNENNEQPELNNNVQPVIKNSPVDNNPISLEAKPKNNNNLLIILFVLMILGVGGYFAYTKLIAKEEPKGNDNLNTNPTPNNNQGHSSKELLIEYNDNFGEESKKIPYKCINTDCSNFYVMNSSSYSTGEEFDAFIYDDGKYLIYNYDNKSVKEVAVPKGDYSYVKINYDKNKKPVSIILERKDDLQGIFSIKSNMMKLDFGTYRIDFPLVDYSIDQYYLISCYSDNINLTEKYQIYSDKEEKIILEKKDMIGCSPTLFYGDGKVYYINLYLHHTGGEISVEEVQSIDGKVLFKNSVTYDFDNSYDYDKLAYNYAVFDEKNHRVIIVDNSIGVFKIYDSNYNLIKTSKKYTNIVPYNNDERYYGNYEYFPQTDNFYLVVNDSGKLNIIDYDENIVSFITNIDPNYKINYIESNYSDGSNKRENLIKIYVSDKTLKIDDYTDADIKKINDKVTRQELLKDYKEGRIELAYEYVYNIASKKIEKNKYFYSTDD